MSLSLGIIGLPNVGKSTLFNALTRSKQANVANYPFCTIDPNVGVVEVPDERLARLAAVSQSKKTIPTVIEFVDIAGLVQGASEGAGLGNKFLAHIRETDAIIQVVRAFTDADITHVQNRVDPAEDAAVINLELALADLQTVTYRLGATKKAAKGAAAKDSATEVAVLERVAARLEQGGAARDLAYTADELVEIKDLHLLTTKPMMYVVNVDDLATGKTDHEKFKQSLASAGSVTVEVSARLEAELADLSPDEAREYMRELGVAKSGLDKIIAAGYDLLGLITYFTSGAPETRAWTVRRGTLAPLAAGVIHTDFIKCFIKADVANWQDFVSCQGWSGVREQGKLRIEGKEYIVQDGDVCYFHIAA
ncbi:MAG: redox-regulated ATPase YchF [Candidatus Magasanikbacteria bacterium]|nr:redox-regulated ATPase YchF [Candidatus Magasanikbacteria bacterium]